MVGRTRENCTTPDTDFIYYYNQTEPSDTCPGFWTPAIKTQRQENISGMSALCIYLCENINLGETKSKQLLGTLTFMMDGYLEMTFNMHKVVKPWEVDKNHCKGLRCVADFFLL